MNIKFSKHKKEVREDPVLDFLFTAKAFAQKNKSVLFGTVIAVAIVLVAAFGYLQMRHSGHENAGEAFGDAMVAFNNNSEQALDKFKTVVEKYPSTSPAEMSSLMLGSIYLNRGSYDEAIQWFERVSPRERTLGFIEGGALEGLASAYEAKGDIPMAIEYLEKSLAEESASYRHPAVRWKLTLLYRKINNEPRAEELCREILSDTTAADYRRQAENLLAALTAAARG